MTCLLLTYKIILWLLLEIFGGRAYFGQESLTQVFLLVNNAFWKKDNMTHKLIDLTNEWHDKVEQADQSILNMLLKINGLELGLIIIILSIR